LALRDAIGIGSWPTRRWFHCLAWATFRSFSYRT